MVEREVLRRAEELRQKREPFALATVVRVERPASAHAGNRALVTREGRLEGWVGGACSEPIVVRESLRALRDGNPRLVRIAPEPGLSDDGVVAAVTTCPSGGTIEVFVEPMQPDPRMVIFGESIAARTLAQLGAVLGHRAEVVSRHDGDGGAERSTPAIAADDAVVIATMGHWDDEAAADALRSPAFYIGLVASPKRRASVYAGLRDAGFDEEAIGRIQSPAGFDLGPASQEEIAVAVLAEVIAKRNASRALAVEITPEPEEAVDPVCGMTVAVAGARFRSEHEGVTYFFCNPHCQETFLADPARYVKQEA